MKKILFLSVLALITFKMPAQIQRKVAATNEAIDTTANSDKAAKGKVVAKKENGRALKQLNLTREQKGKIKEIHQTNKSNRDQIMNDATLSEDQKQEKLKASKRANANGLQEVLTDEQKAKLKTMRSEKKNKDKLKQ